MLFNFLQIPLFFVWFYFWTLRSLDSSKPSISFKDFLIWIGGFVLIEILLMAVSNLI